MKILVLGSNGQLGRCLCDQLKNSSYTIFYACRNEIDITNQGDTKNKILKMNPDVVVNASAYTAVDKAEQYPEDAHLINHFAVANIAKICAILDCWLIHISTDYVFDGTSTAPYRETDTTNPQGIYGASKLDGELSILASECKHLIVRTAWVFSEYGNNFLKTMLRLGSERDELSIVNDQIGCPTYAQDIANAIVCILPKLEDNETISGLYHYCGDTTCSWYEFALAIFDRAKEYGFLTPLSIHTITSDKYPMPAARPKYSVLNCSKIQNQFNLKPSVMEIGVKQVLNLLSKKP